MSYTYHIKQEFDPRLGESFVLYCRHTLWGLDNLIGEYSTGAEAREGMRRAVDRDRNSKEGSDGEDRRVE
jgi:hypothetical protein